MGLGHRWPEIARCYAEVNQLFGDIVKVTPSSKVVGDMALFLFTRGIKPADVVNLPPGTSFPASVIDMLSGGLGKPLGGWPKKVVSAVLGGRKPASALAPKIDLAQTARDLAAKLKREPTPDDLYSHLMYPEVFAEFARFDREYSDVSVLPTPAFFYGLTPGEEVAVNIEAGKTLFIKLVNIGLPDKEGKRIVSYELNGVPRESTILDRSLQTKVKARLKAAPDDSTQVGAPIPGVITGLHATVGGKVAKGDKLITLEAMKMQTTIYAPETGIVAEILVKVGDSVESKDLLLKMRS
jgi:pyruvate carboxylase